MVMLIIYVVDSVLQGLDDGVAAGGDGTTSVVGSRRPDAPVTVERPALVLDRFVSSSI